MLTFFCKKPNQRKRFKIKHGMINELNTYKTALLQEVKKLQEEKLKLDMQLKKNQILNKKFEGLTELVKSLQKDKIQLENDIAILYKAKELTLNINDLKNKESALNSNIERLEDKLESLNKKKASIENDINALRQEKALLIDNIEKLNYSNDLISNKTIYSIEYVDNLKNGLEFENFFAKLLDKLGFYDIKVTSGSGDYGIDVLATSDDIVYGFQCKLYSDAVGNKAIQEAYSGKVHYNCNVVIVVTNNYFTNQAVLQAKETNVLLWNRNTLIKKLEEASKITFTINV